MLVVTLGDSPLPAPLYGSASKFALRPKRGQAWFRVKAAQEMYLKLCILCNQACFILSFIPYWVNASDLRVVNYPISSILHQPEEVKKRVRPDSTNLISHLTMG